MAEVLLQVRVYYYAILELFTAAKVFERGVIVNA